MPRPPRDSSDAVQRAQHIIETSTNIDEVKRAQAVLLPLLGLTLEQTAQAIGKNAYWVSRARNRFIRGETIRKHGGRRNSYFSELQERELVESVIYENDIYWRSSILPTLRKLLAEQLLRETKLHVAESTISDVLDRYAQHYVSGATWGSLDCQQALVILARANHARRLAKRVKEE